MWEIGTSSKHITHFHRNDNTIRISSTKTRPVNYPTWLTTRKSIVNSCSFILLRDKINV